jgi:hypothetical protein
VDKDVIIFLGTNSGALAFKVLPDKDLVRSCIGLPFSTGDPPVVVVVVVEEDDDIITADGATAATEPVLRRRMTSMGGVVVPRAAEREEAALLLLLLLLRGRRTNGLCPSTLTMAAAKLLIKASRTSFLGKSASTSPLRHRHP